jgi:hypothetical protein
MNDNIKDFTGNGKNKDAGKTDPNTEQQQPKTKNIIVEAFDRETCVELLRMTAMVGAVFTTMLVLGRVLGGKPAQAQ